ncbi:hypothetical protein KY285_005283 [Solanum tuberosum]|nr:hypothetical protein KY284_005502 [Solanum tuberosum]KAH0752135.1 hypothetical protein KY285_005283 [Solanum tuberosum]
MIVLLWREGSIHAIDKKYPDYTLYSDKKKVGGDVLTVIQLSLAPNMLCEVSTSTTETTKQLSKRLKGIYQDQLVTTRML